MRKKIAILMMMVLFIGAASVHSTYAADSWSNYKQAVNFMKAKDYAKALPLLAGAESWFVKAGNDTNTAMYYNKLGRTYAELGQYDKAVTAWRNEAKYWAKKGKTQETIAADRKAELIRQDVQLYSKVNKAKTGPSGKYAPDTGVMLGIYAENDKGINRGNADYALNAEGVLGKKHAGFLLYYTYGMDFSRLSVHVANCKATNSYLMLGVQPLEGLNSIQDDAYLEDFAKDIASFEIPVFIRFANEMNDPTNKHWYDKDPKKYIEKFRLVADKVHKLAPNAVMVWAPAYFPPDNITQYYPGDQYVDWVGVSIYRQYHPELDPLERGIDRFSYLDHFSNIYKLYGNKKPIMVAEGAVSYTDYQTGKNVTDFAAKELNNYLTYMPILYPNLKAMFYFDTTTGSKGTSYRLTDNDKMMAVYKQGIQGKSYLSAIGDKAGFTYEPVKDSISASLIDLSSFVKVPDNDCVKVTYAVNGKEVGKATVLPYSQNLDLKPYVGKQVTLTVKGYNGKGTLVVTKDFKLTVKP